MTGIDERYASARFRGLSTTALKAILTTEAADYEPEALALIERELERRETEAESADELEPTSGNERGGHVPRPITQGSSWFDIVAAILGTASVAAPFAVFMFGDVADRGLTVLYIPMALDAYGLARREKWAFYLSFPVLLSMLIVPPSPRSAFEAVARVLWVIGNLAYFILRRESYVQRKQR